jgi:hypothetical protein
LIQIKAGFGPCGDPARMTQQEARMSDSFKTQTHVRLMTRMARTTGTDLDGLSDAEWSGALTKCCGCSNPGSCEDWLEDHADGADAPPSFCANKPLMSGPSA